MLRGALPLGGQVEVHAALVVDTALQLVGIHHHGGQLRDEVDGLAQDILQRQIICVFIIAVHGQHAAGHLVHDVGGRGVHNHVIRKPFRQFPVLFQQLAEFQILLPVGQAAEQQQPHHFLKHEPVAGVCLLHQRVDVNAPVDQTSGNGLDGAVRLLVIADNAGHVGHARQNAGAVRVAQAALNTQPVRQMRVQRGVVHCVFITQHFQLVRLQSRHIRIVHTFRLP